MPVKSKVKRSDFFTPNEISAIFRSCRRAHQRPLIEFLLESGCRISEALDLKISDIVFEPEFLIVTLTGKTGTRTIPLLKSNLPSFLWYITTIEYGRIFPYSYIAIIKQFQRIYHKIGLHKRQRVFHIFRHMKATYLLESGTPENIIKQFMGWSPTSNMIAHYTHLNTKSLIDYFARVYGIATEPLNPLYPDQEKERLKTIFD